MKTQEKYYFIMYRMYIVSGKEVVREKDRVLFFSSEFEREEYARYLNRCEKIEDLDCGEICFQSDFLDQIRECDIIEDFKEIKPLSSMQTAFVDQCMSTFRTFL